MIRDLTDLTLVVDRSGSMSSIKSDAEGGINEFIKNQAEQPGEALLTLVQFDTAYDFVHQACPIEKVGKYRLKPRGATALLDAVGRAIDETGMRLAKMPEYKRPGLVIIVIMTDGHENSSSEFSKQRIKEMIEHQQLKYNWQFVFLGADQDAFAEAGSLGIQADYAAPFAKQKVAMAFKGTGELVGRMRKKSREGEPVASKFTPQERGEME